MSIPYNIQDIHEKCLSLQKQQQQMYAQLKLYTQQLKSTVLDQKQQYLSSLSTTTITTSSNDLMQEEINIEGSGHIKNDGDHAKILSKEEIDALPSKIQHLLKESHTSISSLGKHLEKMYFTDIERIYLPSRWNIEKVKPLIGLHLLHRGYFKTFDIFEQECNSIKEKEEEDLVNEQEVLLYKRLYQLIQAMKLEKFEEIELFCEENRHEKEDLMDKLSFSITKLKIFYLIEKEDEKNHPQNKTIHFMECIQQHLKKFVNHSQYLQEIGELMTCILYCCCKLVPSPYEEKKMNYKGYLEEVFHLVIKTYCNLYALPYDSALSIGVQAGCASGRELRKMACVMEMDQWKEMDQLATEINLDKRFQFHSIFACPVCRCRQTEPYLLSCLHVICKHCLLELTQSNPQKRFKCPACPMEQIFLQTRPIYFE